MGVTTNKLTPKQAKFVKALSKGMGKKDSAIVAGYKESSAPAIASQLLRKDKIVKALEQYGLDDEYIAKTVKRNIDAGVGIKATASDSLRGIELVAKMRGLLDSDIPTSQTNNQYNIYANMTLEELQDKLHTLQDEVSTQ